MAEGGSQNPMILTQIEDRVIGHIQVVRIQSAVTDQKENDYIDEYQ
jgi:hypothetical protein